MECKRSVYNAEAWAVNASGYVDTRFTPIQVKLEQTGVKSASVGIHCGGGDSNVQLICLN